MVTTPHIRPGALLALAATAAATALMLPWRTGTTGTLVPGWYVPGMCATTYDGDGWPSLDCTTGYLSPGAYFPGSGGADGKDTVARVFAAAGVVVTILAWHRLSARLARAAVLVAAAGLLLGGLRPNAGQVVFGVGVALLAAAFRSRGVLGAPGRRPAGDRPGRSGGVRLPPGPRRRSPAAAAPATPPPGAAPGAPRW